MAAPAIAPEQKTAGATGQIVQITGVVVDIEFPADQLPEIYNAVETTLPDGKRLVLEVQQHLGNDRVRAVAMSTTDGLRRGQDVVDTGAAIAVPVGPGTLGRIFNVTGEPIDERARSQATEYPPDPPRGAVRSKSSRPRSKSSKPVPRSSTSSPRSPRAARSASSVAPALARP